MPASPPPAEVPAAETVNRFTLQVATVNGSGSQTANNTLLRALFHMGLPVSGKNLFPSNIQGLPTWFTIRVSEDGYVARRPEVDLLVCMNPATAEQDVRSVPPGALVVYDEGLGCDKYRDDVHFVAAPFQKLVREVCEPVALRKLVVNMIYVGVVAELIGIELSEIDAALDKAFKTKPKALRLNLDAIKAGVDWARENAHVRSPFRAERRDLTRGKILVDGNTAAGIGCVFGGVTVIAWYPITPSSSLVEAADEYAEKLRRDPETGITTCAVVQAEDELAAVGMTLGAGWAGARAMTATSGPGISLMGEFVGLGYFAELPTVIFNVQRTGPSTGLPTRTMQGDLLSTAYLSHGDCRHPCLIPGTIEEAYRFAVESFDLAERLQTPVFVLMDLDLGMNLWMSDPLPYPEKPMDRGKVLDAAGLAAMEGWGRYKDVDGDGVPYRTLPGTPKGEGAFFTRGSGHDEYAKYTESGEAYVRNMDRLVKKLADGRVHLPEPIAEGDGAPVGILAFGTSDPAVVEARDLLRDLHGLETDYLRLRAFPFVDDVRDWIARHDRVYVVEQNRDAQMRKMILMDFPELSARLYSVLHYDGLPLHADAVVEGILAQESSASTAASADAVPASTGGGA